MDDPQLLQFLLRFFRLTAHYEACDSFWWRTDGPYAPYAPVTIFANCNDLFDWACADCERVTPDNIGLLEQSFADAAAAADCGEAWGDSLFCCRVRKMRPQGAYYRNLPKELWPLFDACGPEREVNMANPRPRPQE